MEKFVKWTFESNGTVASSTGEWDSTNKNFTLAFVEPPPNTTGEMTEKFIDTKTIKGNLTFVEDGGKLLMDLVRTRTRRLEAEGTPARDQWSQLGIAIEPLPDELKKLQELIGEWDSEIITGPLDDSEKWKKSKGTVSIRWILDGRYLFITAENGEDRFLWIIGYDSDKKKYQRLTFTNTGQVAESLGYWNGEFGNIFWSMVNEPPGPAKLGQDFIGIDGIALSRGRKSW